MASEIFLEGILMQKCQNKNIPRSIKIADQRGSSLFFGIFFSTENFHSLILENIETAIDREKL
jgi:hypothetical protein